MPPTTLFGLGYGTGPAGYGYPPGARRPSISYPDSPFTWYDHVEITASLPTNGGGPITNYSVLSGSLPAGVSLNAATGELTGTPTTQQSAASVVIRARGPGGVSDTTISVEVLAMPLSLGSSLAAWLLKTEGVIRQSVAVQFAAAGYLSVASGSTIQPAATGFGFMGWHLASSVGTKILICKDSSADPNRQILIIENNGDLIAVVFDAAGGSSSVTAAGAFSGSETWVHFAVWWDPIDSKVHVKVNNGATVDGTGTVTVSSAGSAALELGARSADSLWSADRRLQSLSYLRARIPTASEITTHYNGGSGVLYANLPATLTAESASNFHHWDLTDDSGSRLDSHGSADLTVTGSPTTGIGKVELDVTALGETSASVIQRWEDQSGTGNHVGFDASFPAYRGHFYDSAVQSDSVNSRMRCASLASALDRASLSIGMIVDPSGAFNHMIELGPFADGIAIRAGSLVAGTNSQFLHVYYNGGTVINTGLKFKNRKMWVSLRNNASTLEVWCHDGHYSGAALATKSLTELWLGAASDASLQSPNRYGEVLVVSAALSDAAQAGMNTYLAGRV